MCSTGDLRSLRGCRGNASDHGLTGRAQDWGFCSGLRENSAKDSTKAQVRLQFLMTALHELCHSDFRTEVQKLMRAIVRKQV